MMRANIDVCGADINYCLYSYLIELWCCRTVH